MPIEPPGRLRLAVGLAAIVALFLAPLVVDAGWQSRLVSILLLAMVGSGLNLSFGVAGELNLGQAAVYALGAYVGVILLNDGVPLPVVLGAVVVAAVLVGLLTGLPGLRLTGWPLALLTLFMVFLVPDLIDILEPYTGGYAGLSLATIWDPQDVFYVAAILAVAWFLFTRNLLRSPFGQAFRVLHDSPELAAASGNDVRRLKLLAYVLSVVPASLAGVVLALQQNFLSSTSFSFELVVTFLAICILGGLGSVYGALVGASIVVLLPYYLTTFEEYSTVAYGLAIVIVTLLLPGGVAGIGRAVTRLLPLTARRTARELPPEPPVAEAGPATTDRVRREGWLDARGVTKSFDGVLALDQVDFVARPGEVTALVGPNGSGKTTLLNSINGFVVAERGEIQLFGEQVPRGRPHVVAQLGVGRTFQTPRIAPGMSVADATAAALFSRRGWRLWQCVLRTPGYRRAEAATATAVREALTLVGLEGRARDEAVTLPLGEKRLLEIARAAATTPSLVLLDEPASGLGDIELHQLAAALDRLRGTGAAIVLVEHNMDFVATTAQTVYCLAQGAVIATGPPAEVLADESVLAAWIGEARSTAVGAWG